jgi:hypothetical protein
MFAEHAPKLFERDLPIIPVAKNGKGAVVKWKEYCANRLPTQEEFDEWCVQFSQCNLGLCLGPISGMMVLDIDTDDKEILNMLPASPVTKKGKKGETRFFKYDPSIKALKIHGIVEVLSKGNITVIPPSIHCDTNMPYKAGNLWLDSDNFDSPYEMCPELPSDFMKLIDSLRNYKNSFGQEGVPASGRNIKLYQMTCASIGAGDTDVQTLKKIIGYDNLKHNPPWFTDADEPTRVPPKQFIERIRKDLGLENPKENKVVDISSVLME